MLLAVLWSVPSPEAVTGMEHPGFSSMRKGGISLFSEAPTRWLSYFFGLFVIGVFGLSMAVGYRKKSGPANVKYWLWAGYAAYALIYTGMVVSYWRYIGGQSDTIYFLGVPAPTAWMLFGIWLFPFFFTVLYIYFFDRWVITPEELARFRELVEENRRNRVV